MDSTVIKVYRSGLQIERKITDHCTEIRPQLKSRFAKRSEIRKFGCKYLPIIADFIEKANFEMIDIEEELQVLSNFHAGKFDKKSNSNL